jgi:hypothetical protein
MIRIDRSPDRFDCWLLWGFVLVEYRRGRVTLYWDLVF